MGPICTNTSLNLWKEKGLEGSHDNSKSSTQISFFPPGKDKKALKNVPRECLCQLKSPRNSKRGVVESIQYGGKLHRTNIN